METLPIWCDGCNQQGEIFVDDPYQPVFVVCSNCGFETSQVWCSKCQMGGEFVEEISKRPKTWVCSNCHSEYTLPSDFYLRIVKLSVKRKTNDINTQEYDPQKIMGFTFVGIIIGLFLLTIVKSTLGAIVIWGGIAGFVVFMFYLNNKMKS